MVTYPKRLVFAGVFVVALAVTSYLPRLVQNALHHNQSSSEGYDDSGSAGGMPDGAVSKELRGDTSPARILQAVRDSLQRNDLQSAEVLLRAARALDIDNPQAIALQHELDARTEHAASPTTSAKGVVAPQRAELRPVPRARRTVSRSVEKRERSQRAPLHARKTNDIHQNVNTAENTRIETVAPVPEVIVVPKPVVDPVPEIVRAPAPVVASPPVVQQTVRPAPAPAPIVESSTGPKSRAQVRAELERARTDGSLPRFGNPDPAGPGVSTISKPLPATSNR